MNKLPAAPGSIKVSAFAWPVLPEPANAGFEVNGGSVKLIPVRHVHYTKNRTDKPHQNVMARNEATSTQDIQTALSICMCRGCFATARNYARGDCAVSNNTGLKNETVQTLHHVIPNLFREPTGQVTYLHSVYLACGVPIR